MSWNNDIITSIQAISGTAAMKYKPSVYYATVNDVDIPTRTCSCTLISGPSDISLTSVNLMAAVNDGLLRVPSKNSTVYILHVDGAPPWVDMFSQIDQIFYVTATSLQLCQGATSTDVGINIKLTGKMLNISNANKNFTTIMNNIVTHLNDVTGHLKDVVTHIQALTVTGVTTGPPTGSSGPPANLSDFTADAVNISNDATNINNDLSDLGEILN